ncbi:Hypothetical protein NTJ_14162 [Nesidiocoris tenuis]|uniref:Uncharacterized protein n=1 Tax=Nesidiocoris tenuis TaxID=355587 RepID=A0ABN7BAD2_9HEMI|nr:Hypothetical protein NTJ_14162 [Nesidiocoris tenuis]
MISRVDKAFRITKREETFHYRQKAVRKKIREALTPNVMEVVLADKSLPFSHWSMTTGSGAIRMKEHRVFPFGNENKQLRVEKNVKSSDPRRDRGAWEAV